MTEQEAEALAKRLERIWVGHAKGHWWWQKPIFRFLINYPTGLAFTFDEGPFFKGPGEETGRYVRLRSPENGTDIYLSWQSATGQLSVEFSDGEEGRVEPVSGPHSQQVQTFIDEYLNLFRRNCWLSGCDIEAAAHEKAEWTQGFSREEIEAWNLRI